MFEVSSEGDKGSEKNPRSEKNFFDDEALISSLSLGAGNAFFGDNEEERSSEFFPLIFCFLYYVCKE